MAIRGATLGEEIVLHALIEGAYRGDSAKRGWTHEADLLGGQRTDLAALTEILADPAQTILVHDDGGALNGCVLIVDKGVREGRRIAYLGMLTVRPDLQAGGLGRRLVQHAEAHARGFGADVMEMTVIKQRRELIAWYLRRGYHQTEEERPFPLDDPRFGLPKQRDLVFVVLRKALIAADQTEP
ncbi:MAG: GNAT family N-acetyltransferase [Hyphomonadaceae bacterium]|nr:GNAT family N-acetyltransferase [Hyphomonadaceae bacterium]